MSDGVGLAVRFRGVWRRAGWPSGEESVVVALSGGLDSTVLLHLLRFGAPDGPRPVAAHLDHGMRPGSAGDARWVAGLCRGWSVPLVSERLPAGPSSEAEARRFRYDFLERVRRERGGRVVLTAHHADDQAETVLHRALRGTGPDGLAGILREREPGIVRPLLGFHREELEAYAEAVGLRHRVDPTNADTDLTRNWIRHELLPTIDGGFGERGRRALVRLAELAATDADAWESVLARLEPELTVETRVGSGLDREALLELHPGVRARLLRRLLVRHGVRPTKAQTENLLRFVEQAGSGSELRDLGGVRVVRSFDTLLVRPTAAEETERLTIEGPAGSGRVVLHGRGFRVAWGREEVESAGWSERFGTAELRLPGLLREWRPGDRITLAGGTKKLARLFGEARVPAPDRRRLPVLVDAQDRVLWVPGVARSTRAGPAAVPETMTIAVQEEEQG